jgi:hypothetical protein
MNVNGVMDACEIWIDLRWTDQIWDEDEQKWDTIDRSVLMLYVRHGNWGGSDVGTRVANRERKYSRLWSIGGILLIYSPKSSRTTMS